MGFFGNSSKEDLERLKRQLALEKERKIKATGTGNYTIKSATSAIAKENAKKHKERALNLIQMEIDRIKREIEFCKKAMKK